MLARRARSVWSGHARRPDPATDAAAPAAATLRAQSAPGPIPDKGDPVPVAEEVTPTSGPPGTQVTVRGRGLTNVTAVRFNGVDASFVRVDPTELVATVPEGAGTGPLQLLSPTAPQVIFQNVMSHAVLLTVFLFTALAFAPAGLAAIADEAKGGAEGTTMSAYSLTLSLGFIVGPPVVGAISEAFGGTGMVIYFASLAAGLLALVVTRFFTAGRRGAPPHA